MIALGALMLSVLVPVAAVAEVAEVDDRPCNQYGYEKPSALDNPSGTFTITDEIDGTVTDIAYLTWGQAPVEENQLKIEITAAGEGYEVGYCIKAAAAAAGGENTFGSTTATTTVTHSWNDISHIGFTLTPPAEKPSTGSLMVTKQLTGDLDLINRPIRIAVVCEGDDGFKWVDRTGEDELVLSPEDGAFDSEGKWSLAQPDSGLPIGTECSVTETDDGASDASDVTVKTTINGSESSSISDITITADNLDRTVAIVNDYSGDNGVEVDYEITVVKNVTGNAPTGQVYEICLDVPRPVSDDSARDAEFTTADYISPDDGLVDWPRCVELGGGDSFTFKNLAPNVPYVVYEEALDPEPTGLTVSYSVDGGSSVSDPDGVQVELTEDDPTASVAVTNAFPPPPAPSTQSASVIVQKAWALGVDEDDVLTDAELPEGLAPTFTVTIGDDTFSDVAAGATSTVTGLTPGSAALDVDVSEDMDSLPDADVFAAEGETCQFEGAIISPSELTVAPGSSPLTVTVTNVYSCTAVLDDAEDTPDGQEETESEDETTDEVDIEVEGVVAERPAASPVAQQQAAAPSAVATGLPRTGASALMLTLFGLLSMSFGGALLRPRKRD